MPKVGIYYILLVKEQGKWRIDCESWDKRDCNIVRLENRDAGTYRNGPIVQKIVTSDTDEAAKVARILRHYQECL